MNNPILCLTRKGYCNMKNDLNRSPEGQIFEVGKVKGWTRSLMKYAVWIGKALLGLISVILAAEAVLAAAHSPFLSWLLGF